jgi:hypothetical protein
MGAGLRDPTRICKSVVVRASLLVCLGAIETIWGAEPREERKNRQKAPPLKTKGGAPGKTRKSQKSELGSNGISILLFEKIVIVAKERNGQAGED